MGIKGLWTKVLCDFSQSSYHFQEVIQSRGSRLLIDGMGFLMHVISEVLPKYYPEIDCPREYGGSYRELNELLHAEFSRLQHYLGFEVVVYFDGSESFFKTETLAQRRKQIEETWNNLYNMSLGDCNNIRQRDLPLPPLARDEFINVLQELEIPINYCDFEADQDMAIDCNQYNKKNEESSKRCYCYSADSDFLVMKDCLTIQFGALDAHFPKTSEDIPLNEFEVTVWSRSKIAKLYNIEEQQVVDWCILIGNDFTSHIPKSYYGGQFSDSIRSPRDLLDLIRKGCSLNNYDLMVNEEVRVVVQFSKAFYNCEDLLDYFQEEYKSKNNEDTEVYNEPGTILLETQRIQIRSWAIEHQQTLNKYRSGFSSQLVFEFLQHCKELGMFNVIHDYQMDILQEMHTILENDELFEYDSATAVPFHWSNVCAGNLYQMVSREMKKMYLKLVDGKSKSAFQPCRYFHGKLFHYLLLQRGYSMQKKVISKSTPSSTPIKNALLNTPGSTNKVLKSSDVILPVDAHRDHILETVKEHRVTIIHGETGCGKSSKIPLFLLEDAEKNRTRCRIMISQPRRIAVVNLRNRLKSFLGDKVGMRMGHGVREESKDTKIFFVTTGYLVRLLAHNPQALKSVTHLIVDEVHERSVDGDLLCWLTKRYLVGNLSMKVLLMSATLHTGLYQHYFHNFDMFSSEMPPCLSVGVRRFPVEIKHVEELLGGDDSLPMKIKDLCKSIVKECEKMPSTKTVPPSMVKIQYDLTVALIRKYSILGTGILVFVSGLADIVELQSRFENLTKYRCVAIHSEIPFEDQESALLPAAEDEVKVVIATNAAESSITLPDVDIVICLGTHKAVNYKAGDLLRSTLTNTWISKSSAVQRAGRTGRVRPGKVYRLYTTKHYERFDEHQEAEIHRTPLHEIVLTLKAIFQDSDEFQGVATILKDLLEPPDLSKLPDCYNYLYESNMITAPVDESKLTSHGSFAGKMPTDLILCRLIIFGISVGLGAEAVILASALQQPKTVFRIAHVVVHSDPEEYNGIVRQTMLGMLKFDNNCYSEPLMLLQLFIVWQKLDAHERQDLMRAFGIVSARIRHFISSTIHLLKEVNQHLGKYCPDLTFDEVESNLTPANINKLRLILLWTLDFNLIRTDDASKGVISADSPEFTSVKIPHGSAPVSAIEAEFPPPFKHKISEDGKYIYDLPPLFDSDRAIPIVLKSLFLATQKHGVEQAMIVFKVPQYAPPESYYHLPLHQQQKLRQHIVSYVNVVHIAVSRRILLEVKDNPTKPNLLSLCSGMLFPNIPQNLPEYSDIVNNISTFGLLLVRDEEVQQLSNYLQSCTSIAIICSPNRASKVVAVNFIPEPAVLKAMYPPIDFNSDINMAALIVEKTKQPQKSFDIAQKIEFSKESVFDQKKQLDQETKEDAAGEKKKIESTGLPHIVESIKLPKFSPLFPDLPEGIRLMNAYCLGYKDKHMRVKITNEVEEKKVKTVSPSKSTTSFVPGSIAWKLKKAKEDQQKKEEAEEEEETVVNSSWEAVVVGVKIRTSRWKIMSGNFVPEGGKKDIESTPEILPNLTDIMYDAPMSEWSNVLLSTRSVLSTSCYSPTLKHGESYSPVYGVAYTAISFGENGKNVSVEGVTLFPADRTWILRGLLCMGKRLVLSAEQELDLLKLCDLGKKSYSQRCKIVREMLGSLHNKPFKPDEKLIQALEDLFTDYSMY